MSNDAEDKCAATLIAADPAFSALDASGTPVFAARLDPFCVVYVNAAARELFGDSATVRRMFDSAWPENRRLDALINAPRCGGEENASPRLERATIEIDGEGRRVTLLCRKLSNPTGVQFYALAALGQHPAPDTDHPLSVQLRSRLTTRFGTSPIRFLWKTDAQDRFIAIDPSLAEVVGCTAAKLVGVSVEEAARRLGGGAELIRAIASRRSWSGVGVEWPLADGTGVAPVALGALPAVEGTRSFAGYNGFGVIHISRVRAGAPSLPAANVVPLRPIRAAMAQPEPTIHRETASADERKLTESELSAFAEIARTLKEDETKEDETSSPLAANIPLSDRSSDKSAAKRFEADPTTDAIATVLDRLPIGVLVVRGARTLFVNKALLGELGYADKDAFAEDGGLARIFKGRPSMTTGGPGETIDPHVETIDWGGAPATMISLIPAPAMRGTPERGDREFRLERLRGDNAMLRAVIDALDGGVAILDESGRIESATMGFASLLGADKGAFDGLSVTSIICAEDAADLMARLQRAEAGSPERLLFVPRRGGPSLEAIIARLPVGAGKLYLRLHEPAAREETSARRASERASAAKSGFLARISHEIRTPLSAIIGFAEVMIDERFGPVGAPRYKDYLRDIHASGTHVLSLVNELLDLSNIEADKMDLTFASVDANAAIAECMSIMQPLASGKGIIMRKALAPSLPTIWADSRALQQILLNLLSNAVKFTPAGGQVIVSTAHKEAGYVTIRIKDTGAGMREEEARFALESFTQIASACEKRGAGLGLPLTKALVEASHGSLTIQSCPHEGTLVEIVFPSKEVRAAG